MTIEQAISRAKAYGSGEVPIPGKKAYRDAVFKYSKLSLEELQKLLDKAEKWLEDNKSLERTDPKKWTIATIKVEVMRDAHGKRVVEQLS